MKSIEFYHTGYLFKRINARKAAIAYKNGLTVIVAASNIRPFNCWAHGYMEMNKSYDYEDILLFDNDLTAVWKSRLNAFSFYNLNVENGKDIYFYIPVIVDQFTSKPEYNYNWMRGRGL